MNTSDPLKTIPASLKQGEVIMGYIQGFTQEGLPEVTFHMNSVMHTSVALTTIPVCMELLGRNVVLSFIQGDVTQPIIMGLLWKPDFEKSELKASEKKPTDEKLNDQQAEVEIIQAKDRIELKCGQASLTLTHTGKILLNGTYISSRSLGTHRIKGGAVKVN